MMWLAVWLAGFSTLAAFGPLAAPTMMVTVGLWMAAPLTLGISA